MIALQQQIMSGMDMKGLAKASRFNPTTCLKFDGVDDVVTFQPNAQHSWHQASGLNAEALSYTIHCRFYFVGAVRGIIFSTTNNNFGVGYTLSVGSNASGWMANASGSNLVWGEFTDGGGHRKPYISTTQMTVGWHQFTVQYTYRTTPTDCNRKI